MNLTKGKMACALKVIIYGPEGIGKSTFASHFPAPIFIDTEGSTKQLDVLRVDPAPSTFSDLIASVKDLCESADTLDEPFSTLVIDTADWADKLCVEEICKANKVNGIESFSYGKGYTYAAESFAKLLTELDKLIAKGINIVFTAHAQMRKFEQPDELGAYDRWEMKCSKKTAAMLKEWADIVLFANYKTLVTNVDNQGALKGKNKATGGTRVMYTSHHPCWDAKNRFDLPPELPLDYESIAALIPSRKKDSPSQAQLDLLVKLEEAHVTEAELRHAVSEAGYYGENVPVTGYSDEFITQAVLPNWNDILTLVNRTRSLKQPNEMPF